MAGPFYRPCPDYTRQDNNTWLLELLSIMNCNGAVSNNNNGFYRKLAAAAIFIPKQGWMSKIII